MPVRIAPWCPIFRAVVVPKNGASTQVARLYGRGAEARIDVPTTVAPVTALSRIPTRPGAQARFFVAERDRRFSALHATATEPAQIRVYRPLCGSGSDGIARRNMAL